MNEKRPTSSMLEEITKQIDAEWPVWKRADGKLAGLLYEAWKLHQGRRGAPRKDSNGKASSTFSGYARERGIPLSTAKDLIRRHRERIGEIAPVSESELEKELDGFGQFPEATVEASSSGCRQPSSSSTQDGASGSPTPDEPEQHPAPVDLKALTPEQRTKRKNDLLAEVKKLASEDDFREVQALIDDAVIAILEKRLGGFKRKKLDSKTRRAIQQMYRTEQASKPEWVEA